MHSSPRAASSLDRVLHLRLLTAGIALVTGLAACGGGGSSAPAAPVTAAQACSSSTCGSAIMTLTDAAGDFLTYQVSLVSLQLTQADGSVVETLPRTTTVDLAQLVNLGEILSSRQIPAGNYSSAKVTVDFTGANIMVDDGTGSAVAIAPVDAAGAALGKLTLQVQLDQHDPLSIKGGKASRIAFDFNLLASNSVDLGAKTVTVNPVLVASVVAPDHKGLRIRGSIASVDTTAGDFVVNLKPFEEQQADDKSPLTVHTTDSTAFEIDGKPYSGADGIARLQGLPAGSLVIAFGSLQAPDQSFTAVKVRAGSSVPGNGRMDHLSGDVISRNGNSLTVHAGHLGSQSGDDEFQAHDAVVSLADATTVVVDGQSATDPAHTIAEISVGSHIDAFGTASKDAGGKVTLDATAGRVRLEYSRIAGTLVALGTSQVTVNLSAIDRLPVSLFDFSGTGATPSDPTRYVVDTSTLPLDAFKADGPAQAIGFMTAIGKTPPDFKAVTLSNGAMTVGHDGTDGNGGPGAGEDGAGGAAVQDAAELEIDWGKPGSAAPFKALDAAQLDLDVTNAAIGEHHRIETLAGQIDLTALEADPLLVPASTATALFSIAHAGSDRIENFNSFAGFEPQLATELNGTVTALRLVAEGSYDAATNIFTARHLVIQLDD